MPCSSGRLKQDAGPQLGITTEGGSKALPFGSHFALSFPPSPWEITEGALCCSHPGCFWCLEGYHGHTSHLPNTTLENQIAYEANLVRGLQAGKQNKT